MYQSRELPRHQHWLPYGLLMLLALLLTGLFFSLQQATRLSVSPHSKIMSQKYAMFTDEQSHLSAVDVLSQPFKQVDISRQPVSFGPQTYWHRYTVTNHTRSVQPLVLFIDNSMLDSIKLYQLDLNTPVLKATLGDTIEKSALDLALPHYNFILQGGETQSWLILSQTLGAPNMPLVLFKQRDFAEYTLYLFSLWGSFVGICLLMALYNLILYWAVKDKLYLLYSGYVVSVLIALSIVHGFHYLFLPVSWAIVIAPYIIVSNYIIAYFTLMFALYFLRFDMESSTLFRFSRRFAFAMLPLALLSLFLPEYIAALPFFAIQSLLYCLSALLLYKRWHEGFRWARYYFISWLPLYLGAAVGPMMLSGLLEYNFWTRHSFLLSVTFELTFISMALADRLRSMEQDKLHQALHDPTHGLPNKAYLLQQLNEENVSYSSVLMLVKIKNYQELRAYLTAHQEQELLRSLCHQLHHKLSERLTLQHMEPGTPQSPSCVLVTEDTLGFVLQQGQQLQGEAGRHMFTSPLHFSTNELSLTAICVGGISATCVTENSLEQCISQASQAIQQAMEMGWSLAEYQHHSAEKGKRRVILAADLQTAIQRQELQLFHQPQIYLNNGKIYGSEVLLRWQHKEFGFVAPDEFVMIAE